MEDTFCLKVIAFLTLHTFLCVSLYSTIFVDRCWYLCWYLVIFCWYSFVDIFCCPSRLRCSFNFGFVLIFPLVTKFLWCSMIDDRWIQCINHRQYNQHAIDMIDMTNSILMIGDAFLMNVSNLNQGDDVVKGLEQQTIVWAA